MKKKEKYELVKKYLNDNIEFTITPDGKKYYKSRNVIKAILGFLETQE